MLDNEIALREEFVTLQNEDCELRNSILLAEW